MNIFNYTSYFHDGSLIDIQHIESSITLSMESAEVSSEENLDNIVLSDGLTIKGKLHLQEVYLITANERIVTAPLSMLYDSAGILHFKIHGTTVRLDLEWVNFPPHSKITEYSFYVIHAQKIWWENVPDLHDPFG